MWGKTTRDSAAKSEIGNRKKGRKILRRKMGRKVARLGLHFSDSDFSAFFLRAILLPLGRQERMGNESNTQPRLRRHSKFPIPNSPFRLGAPGALGGSLRQIPNSKSQIPNSKFPIPHSDFPLFPRQFPLLRVAIRRKIDVWSRICHAATALLFDFTLPRQDAGREAASLSSKPFLRNASYPAPGQGFAGSFF